MFGPFQLGPLQRVLHEGERPVHLGSRSLEILVERAGELVGTDGILARVWRRDDAAETFRHRRELLWNAEHPETLCTLSEELVGAATFTRAETGRAGWCASEILRANGDIILKEGHRTPLSRPKLCSGGRWTWHVSKSRLPGSRGPRRVLHGCGGTGGESGRRMICWRRSMRVSPKVSERPT